MTDTLKVYPARARAEASGNIRDFAAELNPQQAAAATYGDGPLLIIAGAGTGKTRTLVYRVAHLIERGVAAERILLLTFTRRAAQEMLSRAERLVGGNSKRVHGGTFHATAHRLLRRYGQAAGLPKDFTIMDQGDSADLMQLSRAQLGYAAKSKRFPKKETLQYVYSRHINTEISVEDIVRDSYPQFVDYLDDFAKIYADYTRRKQERNLVDYDDLLLFWALLLEASPELGKKISGLYDHVLVDEYQDTNVLQARILRGMCAAHKNITVVGDDAQSVYSFRGANFRNILDFPRQFPGATMVALEQNYRSTQPILSVTNALISRAAERFTKNLWTERTGGEAPWLVAARDEQQQTQFVVDRILELHEEGTRLSEIAVLFRAGYMSADLEIELTNRKIPFEKWGGLKFLEAAHVKDVLAFLRILENPRDEVSWYRLLLLLPGIGDDRRNGGSGVGIDGVRALQSTATRASCARRARRAARRAAIRTHTRRSPGRGRYRSGEVDVRQHPARALRSRRAETCRPRSAADHRRRLPRSRDFSVCPRARATPGDAGSRHWHKRRERCPHPQHRSLVQG